LNNPSILLVRDIKYNSYVDFVKDPLDFSNVNTELVEGHHIGQVKILMLVKKYLVHLEWISGFIYSDLNYKQTNADSMSKI